MSALFPIFGLSCFLPIRNHLLFLCPLQCPRSTPVSHLRVTLITHHSPPCARLRHWNQQPTSLTSVAASISEPRAVCYRWEWRAILALLSEHRYIDKPYLSCEERSALCVGTSVLETLQWERSEKNTELGASPSPKCLLVTISASVCACVCVSVTNL
jgi:hypothetical protein